MNAPLHRELPAGSLDAALALYEKVIAKTDGEAAARQLVRREV